MDRLSEPDGTDLHTSLPGVLRCPTAGTLAARVPRLLTLRPRIAATAWSRSGPPEAARQQGGRGLYPGQVVKDLFQDDRANGANQETVPLRHMVQQLRMPSVSRLLLLGRALSSTGRGPEAGAGHLVGTPHSPVFPG